MPSSLRRALWFAGVPLTALAGGYAGFFPVFTMGLVTPLYLVGPLALLTGALLAALPAAWLANFAARGESRSRLLAPIGVGLLGLVTGLAASTAWGCGSPTPSCLTVASGPLWWGGSSAR